MAQSSSDQPILVIVGPTASGKTALSIDLATQLNGEIICADSRTIYKDFDIGTAKPTTTEQSGIMHYGLDIVEPGQVFSAYDFKRYALEQVEHIRKKNKLPIMVGGTGLYIDSVLFDYEFRTETKTTDFSYMSDDELVAAVTQRYPAEIAEIDIKNRLRVEQLMARGPAPKRDLTRLKIPAIIVGMKPEMLDLKKKIAQRVEDMMSKGFVQEVKSLIDHYGRDCPQLNVIGYRFVSQYLDGTLSLDEAKTAFVQADYALAKRQMTWFARNPHIHWFGNPTEAEDFAIKALSQALQ